MAVGTMFKLGEIAQRPSINIRFSNDGNEPSLGVGQKVGAALIQSNWGPVGKAQTIYARDLEKLKGLIGTGKGPDVVKSFLVGGASAVQVIRVGNGGGQATAQLGAEAGVVKFVTKYPTDRALSVMIRESVMGDEKDVYIIEDDRRLESYRISGGGDEAETLVEAMKKSNYLIAVKEAEGTLPESDEAMLEGGENPKSTAEDYTDAMVLSETVPWDVVVSDTHDISVHNALATFVRRRVREGHRVWTVLAMDPEIDFELLKETPKMYNYPPIFVVGMAIGDLTIEETTALVAGETIRGDYLRNLSQKPMPGVTTVETLTQDQYEAAAKAGLIVFDYNHKGQVVLDYAVNTLQNSDEEIDMGWRSLRRMRTRYELVDRIVYEVAELMQKGISIKDTDHIITIGNTVIDKMIKEGGLESGRMIVDPDLPPEGDSAWFTFDNLVDLDGLNKVYIHFPFAFKR